MLWMSKNKSRCFIFTILSPFDWWQLRNSLRFAERKEGKNVKNTQPLPCLFLIYAQIVLHQALSGTPLIKWGILLNCSTFALKVVWFNKWNEKARCHISVDQMHCDLQSQQYTWNLLENCLLFFSLISYPTYPTYPTYSTNDNKKLCPDAMFNFFCPSRTLFNFFCRSWTLFNFYCPSWTLFNFFSSPELFST